MVDLNKIKQDIKDDIRANGRGEITGQILQDILLELVDTEGQIYKESKEELAQLAENVSETIESVNIELSNKADATETLQQISAVEETITEVEMEGEDNKAAADEKIAQVEESLDAKADPTGYYPTMSVGFADNLIGRGEATAEEFTYRPTNGKDPIEDEVARVTKIKGNSVVWNQGFNTSSLISYDYLTVSKVDEITFELNGTAKDNLTWIASDGLHSFIASHKVYVYAEEIGGEASINYHLDNGWGVVFSPNTPQIIDVKYTDSGLYIRGGGCTFNNLRIRIHTTDLTKMFGAGNEPSTIEEFYSRIPSGIDVNVYNDGEIISMHTEAIKAVGFNQFNGSYARVIVGETYYLGGTYTNIGFATEIGGVTEGIAIPEDKLYKPTRDGYIYAEGTDICINLSHTGWKNGTYEPYREFTREIPVIKKYFPDGMKKAGNAFDSIEWDSIKQKWVAVQRIVGIKVSDYLNKSSVGVFTLKNLPYNPATEFGTYSLNVLMVGFDPDTRAWDNKSNGMPSVCAAQNRIWLNGDILLQYATAEDYANVLGDTLLYYAIAEPFVTEIEDDYLNFDYDAEDFGTEEALSSIPSAPLSADIIYKFNAVDSIRQNRLDIKALQELVLSLQSQISAMQTAQVKEQE